MNPEPPLPSPLPQKATNALRQLSVHQALHSPVENHPANAGESVLSSPEKIAPEAAAKAAGEVASNVAKNAGSALTPDAGVGSAAVGDGGTGASISRWHFLRNAAALALGAFALTERAFAAAPVGKATAAAKTVAGTTAAKGTVTAAGYFNESGAVALAPRNYAKEEWVLSRVSSEFSNKFETAVRELVNAIVIKKKEEIVEFEFRDYGGIGGDQRLPPRQSHHPHPRRVRRGECAPSLLLRERHTFSSMDAFKNRIRAQADLPKFGWCGPLVLFFLAQTLLAQAGGIGITSKTEFQCVDLILWLEDSAKTKKEGDPEKTEADAPEEYRSTRKTVGIGENITLTLIGDEKNIGDVSKIKWEITEGTNYALFIVKNNDGTYDGTTTMEGLTSVVLHILLGTSERNGQKVKVKATTGVPTSAEIEFNIKTPDGGFKSRHYDPPEFVWRHVNGDVGASAKLRVFPTPTSVNFSGGVGLLEVDGGSPLDVKPTEEDEKKGTEKSAFKGLKHNVTPDFWRVGIWIDGGVEDRIWFRRERLAKATRAFDYRKMTASHSCYWLCGWYWREIETNDGKFDGKESSRGEKMQSLRETFSVANDGKGTTVIAKFNSKVTRVARGNNKNRQIYE